MNGKQQRRLSSRSSVCLETPGPARDYRRHDDDDHEEVTPPAKEA